MTLADILKPSLTIVSHAQLKGIQIGAAIGTLSAIPCILFRPSLINQHNDPPLVAIANIAGIGAAVGVSSVTLACAYKLSKIGKEGIVERADKICANQQQNNMTIASGIGAASGVALVVARVWGLSKSQRKCVYGLTFRKQTAWEIFAFGSMGIAIGAAVFMTAKKICDKIESANRVQINEVDEGDAQAVVETEDDVVNKVDKVE